MAKQAELQLAKKKGTDFHFISALYQKCPLAPSVIWAYRFRTLCTTRDLQRGSRPDWSPLGFNSNFPVDLHRSKPLISLVSFDLHFHCFQG